MLKVVLVSAFVTLALLSGLVVYSASLCRPSLIDEINCS